jgi:hypothetical protein
MKNLIGVMLLLSAAMEVAARPHAFPVQPRVTLSWDHYPGPYSYNVYEITNLMGQWTLKTNTPDLSIQLPIESEQHFFTVSCVDTNTGLESDFATQ